MNKMETKDLDINVTIFMLLKAMYEFIKTWDETSDNRPEADMSLSWVESL